MTSTCGPWRILPTSPQAADSNADEELPETPAPTEAPDAAEPADEQPEETSSEGGRTLVVYYSASGNTAAVAGYIADALGADTFELVPQEPYSTDDLNWTVNGSRVNREHDDESLRDIALVADSVDHWGEYDTVFIGYPIWWAIAAWPVNNFVKNNDFTGKLSSRSARPLPPALVKAASCWLRWQAQATGRPANAFAAMPAGMTLRTGSAASV